MLLGLQSHIESIKLQLVEKYKPDLNIIFRTFFQKLIVACD